MRIGKNAVAEYNKLIELDSSKIEAVKGVAYLYMQMKQFDEAKANYRKATEIDPKDPEPYYSIAVIDWTRAYQPRMEMRSKLGLRPEQPLIHQPKCAEIRLANEDLVKEGMDMLVESLTLRPDCDDAMAYMNLLYRERADMQCGDPKAYRANLKEADRWVDLTMATKKAKAEHQTPE